MNSNSNYPHHQKTEAKIEAEIIKVASADSTAAVIYDKIKDENLIQCTLKRIYRAKVVGEEIVIQTTNNNCGPVVRLLEMMPLNAIFQYYLVR